MQLIYPNLTASVIQNLINTSLGLKVNEVSALLLKNVFAKFSFSLEENQENKKTLFDQNEFKMCAYLGTALFRVNNINTLREGLAIETSEVARYAIVSLKQNCYHCHGFFVYMEVLIFIHISVQ